MGTQTAKYFLVIGSLSMALSIAAGAFGTHALKETLAPNLLNAFQTSVNYHMFHSIALLLIGILLNHTQEKLICISGLVMLLGLTLFSGSLYALSLSGVTQLGIVTPIGGIYLIISWLLITSCMIKYF